MDHLKIKPAFAAYFAPQLICALYDACEIKLEMPWINQFVLSNYSLRLHNNHGRSDHSRSFLLYPYIVVSFIPQRSLNLFSFLTAPTGFCCRCCSHLPSRKNHAQSFTKRLKNKALHNHIPSGQLGFLELTFIGLLFQNVYKRSVQKFFCLF